jgi:hypothetical protein
MQHVPYVKAYLKKVEDSLGDADKNKKKEIISDIEGQINERLEGFKEGMGEGYIIQKEDVQGIIEDFGPPDELALEYKMQIVGSDSKGKSSIRFIPVIAVGVIVILVLAIIASLFFISIPEKEEEEDDTIYMGEGLKKIKIGDEIEKVIDIYGTPEERADLEKTIWLSYRSSEGIDFLISNYTGTVAEIRFNSGYDGYLENNVKIGDTLDVLFIIDGDPMITLNGTKEVIDHNPEGGNRILYRIVDKDGVAVGYKFIDERKGVLYWTGSDRFIHQIVVFDPIDEGEIRGIDIQASIDSFEDLLTVEIYSGSIKWDDYLVLVDNKEIETIEVSSSYGDSVQFFDPSDDWDPIDEEGYVVKVILISESTVVYEAVVIADERTIPQLFQADLEIYGDLDTIVITMISGSITWNDYLVLVDGVEMIIDNNVTANETFAQYHDPSGSMDFSIGSDYNVKMVKIEENMVVYENDIIAIAY